MAKSNTDTNTDTNTTRNRPNRDLDLEARWRRIVREHGRGGLTVREFCRSRDLTETAFYYSSNGNTSAVCNGRGNVSGQSRRKVF